MLPIPMRRLLLSLLPTPLAFGLAAWASASVADRAGAEAALALASVAVLARVTAEPPTDDTIPTEVSLVAWPVAAPPPAMKSKKGGKAQRPSAPLVLFVSRERVLGVAASGARPRGAPVPATATRPAGLRLTGVAALGVGLRDGDVLTRALGMPATSSGAVVQAVLFARARHTAVLEGEFWREGQRWIIRVEQPYLDERRSEAAEPTPSHG